MKFLNPDDNQGNQTGTEPVSEPQAAETCTTCGGASANGTCTNCNQPNAGCSCPPAAPTGGQGEVGGGVGGPGPSEPPAGPSVPPAV